MTQTLRETLPAAMAKLAAIDHHDPDHDAEACGQCNVDAAWDEEGENV